MLRYPIIRDNNCIIKVAYIPVHIHFYSDPGILIINRHTLHRVLARDQTSEEKRACTPLQ